MRTVIFLVLFALIGAAQAQAPTVPCPTNLFQWVAPTATAQGYYECVVAPVAPPPAYVPPPVIYAPPPVYYPPYYPRPPWHPDDHGPAYQPDHH